MGVPALNFAPLLPEGSLQDCEEAQVVLKHDPITNYPRWQQWLLYFTYWITNYDGGIQLMSVCTSEENAKNLCKDAGYRVIRLPIDESLPEERCQWKPAIHPLSPFKKRYENYTPKYLAINTAKLRSGLDGTEYSLSKLKTILTAVEDN